MRIRFRIFISLSILILNCVISSGQSPILKHFAYENLLYKASDNTKLYIYEKPLHIANVPITLKKIQDHMELSDSEISTLVRKYPFLLTLEEKYLQQLPDTTSWNCEDLKGKIFISSNYEVIRKDCLTNETDKQSKLILEFNKIEKNERKFKIAALSKFYYNIDETVCIIKVREQTSRFSSSEFFLIFYFERNDWHLFEYRLGTIVEH